MSLSKHEELRLEALKLASSQPVYMAKEEKEKTTSEVVARAEAYHAFLLGKKAVSTPTLVANTKGRKSPSK